MTFKKKVQRPRVQLFCEDVTRTHQNFKDECDIRNIMSQYKRTGLVSHMTKLQGQYGDFTNIPSFREALDVVIEAQDMFNDLPASIRKRFDNDPALFLDFVGDSNNIDEMINLGLASKPAQQGVNKTSPSGEPTPPST